MTNFTELNPSREAASCTAAQELPSSLWKPKVYCRVHKSPLPVHILSQINSESQKERDHWEDQDICGWRVLKLHSHKGPEDRIRITFDLGCKDDCSLPPGTEDV
jgi:hypothetical protein